MVLDVPRRYTEPGFPVIVPFDRLVCLHICRDMGVICASSTCIVGFDSMCGGRTGFARTRIIYVESTLPWSNIIFSHFTVQIGIVILIVNVFLPRSVGRTKP
jgi:hypothetical protein